MDRERWARIEAICAGALDSAPADRLAYIDGACSGDESLRRDVVSLIEQLEAEPEFLERPAISREHEAGDTSTTLASGVTVGAYVLERLLGRGGMGEVYLATRDVDGVSQQVALKVIRRGMDTDEVLRRFRLERRILASLHHPNVAQLLDAGATADGRPWVAMEYVDGAPLAEYCDAQRLAVPERLRLFQKICAAVQHAHQRLVVHRDLKPKNILVAQDGTPKLLDFGIGKVLGDSDAFGTAVDTRTELRLLTPEYAAPEQLTGAQVTTATDVYALGVMLYELLAGRHPYANAGITRAEIEKAVLESPPPRPNIVEDLDTIVLMAMRREPERRYPTAAALADDIQRHLDGLPVSARPDTLGYRMRKFVGRNTGAVIGASAVAVALVAVTGVSVVQSRRVADEAARTAQERDKALEVRGFLMEMFGATGAGQSVGDTVSVRALLDRQRESLDRAYAGKDAVKADMLEVLADGYDRLGLYADAEPLAQQALDLRRRLLPPSHPDLATSLNLLGWIHHERGRSADAEPLLLEAAQLRRALPERSVDGLSRSLNDLGVVYNALRRFPDAERVLREALDIRRRVFGDAHRTVGITANNLAAAFYFQQRLDSAIAVQGLALRSLQASVGPDHQRTIVALGNLAAFRRAKGELAHAESAYRELAVKQARLQGREHPVTARVLISLAIVLTDRATSEKRDTLLTEAEGLYREAVASFESKLGNRHPDVGSALHRLAGVMLLRRRPHEAVELGKRALAIQRASAADTSAVVQQIVARLAQAHRVAGDSAAATALLRQFRMGER